MRNQVLNEPTFHVREVACLSAILALAAVLYWPAQWAGFVGDDYMILHRLRAVHGPADMLGFFGGEFFEYYRPLGFLSHAVDWLAAGAEASRFHRTNILLHAISTLFVFLIASRLSPRTLAAPLAALLFGLHASNHEAVVWMSARFDLLATCLSLFALCWMVRRWPADRLAPAVLFFLAVLSKESAVALPIAAAAWGTLVLREDTRRVALRVAPWIAALVIYSVLRQAGGGVSAVGGASRLPKLLAFLLCVAAVVALADGRWVPIRDVMLRRRRTLIGVASAALLLALAAAILEPARAGEFIRGKFAVAAFALFYLTTPILDPGTFAFSDPSTNAYWLGGAAGLAVLLAVAALLWRRALTDARVIFVLALLGATLLPISALTEGKRYLYLPSAALALVVGVTIAELHGRRKVIGVGAVALMLVVSAAQVRAKVSDWIWAGTMTATAARAVDAALAPSCGSGQVVFLTSPVAIRGVYTHFYYETFELPRGCTPALFQVLLRIVREDADVRAAWTGPTTIVLSTPEDRGNFVASSDLRQFDRPIARGTNLRIDTSLGLLQSVPSGDGRQFVLSLDPQVLGPDTRFFYYSGGAVHALESPSVNKETTR